MPLNASGPISLGGSTVGESVNLIVGNSATTTISFNSTSVRTLTGTTANSTVSMPSNFWGKTYTFSLWITSNTTNVNLRSLAVASGWDQVSKVAARVVEGVYVYSTDRTVAAITIDGSWPGGLQLLNLGYIMGMGGDGGAGNGGDTYVTGISLPPTAGGPAIVLGTNCQIINNSNAYIMGGGGGGGNGAYGGGGGGAGGGNGGGGRFEWMYLGGLGGAPGASGSNQSSTATFSNMSSWPGAGTPGGGGGRKIPGNRMPYDRTLYVIGPGGEAGGGGGSAAMSPSAPSGGGYGGGYEIVSGVGSQTTGGSVLTSYAGGGGGGYGASSGAGGNQGPNNSTAGGKAIVLNGYTCDLNNNGTIWGGVS